jgi:UDP-3-O-[3-hydroxymyristoyl] N-acetylglucosamine deacetylase
VINNQRTVSKNIKFKGIGLHSGEPVEIKLSPDEIDAGISFIINKKKINASWKNAEVSQLCTKIKLKNNYLLTIEHLMSALSGLEITNLTITTNSSEMPILDGSAKDFIETILSSGLKEQKKSKKILKIKKKITYSQNNKFIEIEPNQNNGLSIDYTIDYKDDFIKKQSFFYEHSFQNYNQIYKARTFCLHKDLAKIFAMGLGKGGSLDNAIIVSGNKILNQGGLRYENEFVKHKVLDCIGDLYLAEYPIFGKVKTLGGGHELNLMLLREIFKDKKNYEIIDLN